MANVTYDPDALRKNIKRIEEHIKIFENEIKEYQEKLIELKILLKEAEAQEKASK
ncbi:MAG: hypothetical protein KatS3mg002_0311 [Candidatus Woesearchaeota archaeon]|nr:MAG: hypothetical protein KatS3mg002_0311 [Candidatus Woesearchaeota archaeon]